MIYLKKSLKHISFNKQTLKHIYTVLICFSLTIFMFFSRIYLYQKNQYSYAITPKTTYQYIGNLTIFTLNPLIAFTSTFEKNNNKKDNQNFTVSQFKNLLKTLHKNNFILVNSDIISPKNIENNTVKITLPLNKKPLILNFKNLDYSNKYTGFIDKYILDRNNHISTYTKQEYIHDRVSNDNDFIPILENFLNENPDFSYKSARANLIVNGDKGFLGYEIQPTNQFYKHEQRELSKVTKRLKSLGYNFIYGCYNHNYLHQKTDYNSIEKDFSYYKKHCLKTTEKNNQLYIHHSNIENYSKLLKQKYITFIEDYQFNTHQKNNLTLLSTIVLTPQNIDTLHKFL